MGNVAEALWFPEVPVSVILNCPKAAVEEAWSVKVLDPFAVGLGEKEAVTPAGKPEAVRCTLPVKV
jgi:hypothetical protein